MDRVRERSPERFTEPIPPAHLADDKVFARMDAMDTPRGSQDEAPAAEPEPNCPLCYQPYGDIENAIACEFCHAILCMPCSQATTCVNFQPHHPDNVWPHCANCQYRGRRATYQKNEEKRDEWIVLFTDMENADISNEKNLRPEHED